MDNDNPVSFEGEEYTEAEENSKSVKACAERAIDAIYAIKNYDSCKEKEEKIKQLHWLLYHLRFTLQFKLYTLSTLDSYLPYTLVFRLNREIKKWQTKHACKSQIKENNWKYLGYAFI